LAGIQDRQPGDEVGETFGRVGEFLVLILVLGAEVSGIERGFGEVYTDRWRGSWWPSVKRVARGFNK
jgi:hypothetical protein